MTRVQSAGARLRVRTLPAVLFSACLTVGCGASQNSASGASSTNAAAPPATAVSAPPAVQTADLHARFDAKQAYAYTVRVAGFGERPPGSPGHRKTDDLIRSVLAKNGAVIETDEFMATTPRGPVPVRTIIGKFNVTDNPAQPILILAGHYDTLFKRGFVGANDGGSSTGILLAFADAIAHQPMNMQIWLVWTDLEEAIADFTADDGLYGSRHLASRLTSEGLVPRVKSFFLLDMIGDKDLIVTRETGSTRWLQDFIEQAARELGYQDSFFRNEMAIIDDHVPFLQAGIPAVDVVDAHYGRMGFGFDSMGEFHHANTDTMDKVSAQSLEIVGTTILLTVEIIDRSVG
jgi:Zn-dependent M28 family amino/carboxypeptidase